MGIFVQRVIKRVMYDGRCNSVVIEDELLLSVWRVDASAGDV